MIFISFTSIENEHAKPSVMTHFANVRIFLDIEMRKVRFENEKIAGLTIWATTAAFAFFKFFTAFFSLIFCLQ